MADEPHGYATTDDAQKANEETWRKFRKDFQQKPITYGAILVLIELAILVLGFHVDFMTMIAPQLLSIAVIVFLVNELQKRRELKHIRLELMADLQNGSKGDAIRAIKRMQLYDDDYGWYSGPNSLFHFGSLNMVDLSGVNLYGANFKGAGMRVADLEGANLCSANLEGVLLTGTKFVKANLNNANLQIAGLIESNFENAQMFDVNLKNAYLRGAVLVNTKMVRADLRGANLVSANLEGADLSEAQLQDADLRMTNLKGCKLLNAEFSSGTILPDAKSIDYIDGKDKYDKYYDPNKGPEQMNCYTDPDHPNFWDPCDSYNLWYCSELHQYDPRAR